MVAKDHFHLIITVALKKELPIDWLNQFKLPVYTLKALKSGILNRHTNHDIGVLVIISGVGKKNSFNTAHWIVENLQPKFVINMGSSGSKTFEIGTLISPTYCHAIEGPKIKLDDKIPFSTCLTVNYNTEVITLDNDKSYHHIIPAQDMEVYHQAKVFQNSHIHFQCVKIISDNTLSDFNKNITLIQKKIKNLLSFLDFPTPTISAIIPVYNRPDWIHKSIQSILNQTLQPKEVIIVDDGSSRLTKEALLNYSSKIKIITHLLTKEFPQHETQALKLVQALG